MVEVEQGQRVSARFATDEDWRFVAACVAAQVVGCGGADEERRLGRLWSMLHPEGEV